jgi:hypothetical protein
MPLQPPTCCCVIFGVFFYDRHLEAHIVSRDCTTHATAVRIENPITRLGIVRKQPFVEYDRFLSRMYSNLVKRFIALLNTTF